MKLYFIVSLLLLGISSAFSQHTITYEYDAAGNRISQNLIILNTRRAVAESKDSIVHTEKLQEFTAKIYPNPTEGLLKVDLINLPRSTQATIHVHDMSGRLLIKKENVEYSTDIDLTAYAAGTYIMRIFAGESKSEWKIIKR